MLFFTVVFLLLPIDSRPARVMLCSKVCDDLRHVVCHFLVLIARPDAQKVQAVVSVARAVVFSERIPLSKRQRPNEELENNIFCLGNMILSLFLLP